MIPIWVIFKVYKYFRLIVVLSAVFIFLWQSCRSKLQLTTLRVHNAVQTEGAAAVAWGQSLRDLDLSRQVRNPQKTKDKLLSAPRNDCIRLNLPHNLNSNKENVSLKHGKNCIHHSGQNCFSLTVFSVLLVLKIEGYLLPASVSWFLVFAPLFICDGLNAYFCIIVFIRQYLESQFRVALLRAIWSLFVIGTYTSEKKTLSY